MGINIQIDPFWGAIITLALSDSAFTAEIYRSGIQSIAKGQAEAARTVGLTYAQTMRYVILPQAIRRILPPLANQFIYIVKMSARCDSCIGFHVKSLIRLGITRDELVEALAMATYMGGGPSYAYSAKALKAFEEFS